MTNLSDARTGCEWQAIDLFSSGVNCTLRKIVLKQDFSLFVANVKFLVIE